MVLIDNRIYVAGRRAAAPKNLDETYELLRQRDGMAWIGLYRPDDTEIHSIAAEFSLHPLAVEDALKGHQRAEAGPVRRHLVRRAATGLVSRRRGNRRVRRSTPVHRADFVVTVRHAAEARPRQGAERMEDNPELLARGPQAVLYAVLDEVVDGYGPVDRRPRERHRRDRGSALRWGPGGRRDGSMNSWAK